MKRIQELSSNLEQLMQTYNVISQEGMSRASANIVMSLEGDSALPYMPNAYSRIPSTTFRTASLESLSKLILDKLGQGISIVIEYVTKFIDYLAAMLDGKLTKGYAKQGKYNEKAQKQYRETKKEFDQKVERVTSSRSDAQERLELQQTVEGSLDEALNEARERLDHSWNKLCKDLCESGNAALPLVVPKQSIKELNGYVEEIISHVKEGLSLYASGDYKHLHVRTNKAYVYKEHANFMKKSEQINLAIARTKLSSISIPPYPTQEDKDKPHLFLSHIVTSLRNAAEEPSEIAYSDAYVKASKSAGSNARTLGDQIVKAFTGDEVRTLHAKLIKTRKELLATKKKLDRRGINNDEMKDYYSMVSKYMSDISVATFYGIRYRQVNKLLLRTLARFLNAETHYYIEHSKYMQRHI